MRNWASSRRSRASSARSVVVSPSRSPRSTAGIEHARLADAAVDPRGDAQITCKAELPPSVGYRVSVWVMARLKNAAIWARVTGS